mmetsp:Transcript_79621/g.165398  ORF Transcript_79621/g.165398 Transcript_79621/m.165398 type:complete len:230 (+) Transcript_79621:305-994(+)
MGWGDGVSEKRRVDINVVLGDIIEEARCQGANRSAGCSQFDHVRLVSDVKPCEDDLRKAGIQHSLGSLRRIVEVGLRTGHAIATPLTKGTSHNHDLFDQLGKVGVSQQRCLNVFERSKAHQRDFTWMCRTPFIDEVCCIQLVEALEVRCILAILVSDVAHVVLLTMHGHRSSLLQILEDCACHIWWGGLAQAHRNGWIPHQTGNEFGICAEGGDVLPVAKNNGHPFHLK